VEVAYGEVMASTAGTLWRRVGVAVWVVMLAGLTAVMWSDRMSAWWGDQSSGDAAPAVPEVLEPAVSTVLEARPSTNEADVHVLLWGGLAAVMMLVFPWPSRRARLVGLAGLFAYSVVVEVLQPVLSSRSAAWGDVAGNAAGVGLVAVAVVATVAFRSAVRPLAARVSGGRWCPGR
jgi:hypothetical protein